MPKEVDAPEVGIGPASESPDKGARTPQALFSPSDDFTPSAPSEGAPETPASGPADDFDWSTVSLRRTKIEDVPERYRPAYRKMQDEFRAVQGDTDRRVTDLTRREQQIENERQRLLVIQEQMSRPTTPAAAVKAQREGIRDMLKRPDLDQDSRQALTLIEDELSERINEAVKPYKDIADLVPQLQAQVQQLNRGQQENRVRAIALQVEEANALYGAENVTQYTPQILVMMGLDGQLNQTAQHQVNPATRKPYTVAELVSLFSGLTAEAAQGARTEDANIRKTSKASVKASPPVPGPAGAGQLSRREALDGIRALGFGK